MPPIASSPRWERQLAKGDKALVGNIADLDSLTETDIEQDGKRFTVRYAPRPAATLTIRAPERRISQAESRRRYSP
jgi:hypothetical protein